MAVRFTYSRWDGSQRGFDLDADALFGQLTDELLYHGDVNAALRRMIQEGLRTPDGDRVHGLREMLERLRHRLTGCIGCGCLSMAHCGLMNPADLAAESGPGARYVIGEGPEPD